MGMTTQSRFSWLGFVMLVLVALSGCAKKEASPASAAPQVASEGQPTSAQTRARALNVDTSLVVDDVEAPMRSIRDAVDASGGYVADAAMSGEDDERTARFDLRIPADALKPFMAKVSAVGKVTGYSERAEDVTDQRTDLKARLKNARTQEARIQDLMEKKTSTLGEIIEAEKELARVRENIERLDAQDRTMDGRVSFATVHVNLATRNVEAWRTPGSSIAHAATAGMRGAAAVFVFLAMAFVTVAPTLVPFVLVLFAAFALVRTVARRRRNALLRAE
jgi:hypothetical protein